MRFKSTRPVDEQPAEKLTVLFLGALPPPSIGPTLATKYLLASSLAERHNIVHLDTSDHRPMTTLSAIDWTNILVALRSYIAMVRKLAGRKFDLVYIPISQTTIGYLKDSVYILIAKLFRTKVVTHLRGGNFRNWLASASGFTRLYVKSVHGLVDAQIVLGEKLRALFDGVLPPTKIHVVPNGRDFEALPLRRPSPDVRFLFLSNVRKEKGVLDFLSGAVMLAAEGCFSSQFIVAGSRGARGAGTVDADIDSLLKQHPEFQVTFVEKLDDNEKRRVLANADVFVFPTYYSLEGHPWVIVEAMAAGLPIISCDQGCIVESVIDGENGFIVPKRNPRALMEAMRDIGEDAERRKEMGARSRMLYEKGLTESASVARLSNVLEVAVRPRSADK